jgi:hypothetical protein
VSNDQIIYAVSAGCGLAVLLAFVLLIVRPAWSSYSGAWQRAAALFLSLYVLAAFVGIGAGVGVGIFWFWDRIQA